MRDAVGTDVAVTAKLSMTDGVKGGLGVEEASSSPQLLEQDGALDALQLSGGSSLMNPMYLFRGDVPAQGVRGPDAVPVRPGHAAVGQRGS